MYKYFSKTKKWDFWHKPIQVSDSREKSLKNSNIGMVTTESKKGKNKEN